MNTPASRPPRWGRKVLEFFLRSDYADEILGDIIEAFHWRAEEEGMLKARLYYTLEVLRSLRPANLRSFHYLSLNTMIFRNYFKIAIRSLFKRKSTSFINIFGLSVGISAFIMIFLYTNQILTFDDTHIKKDRIFMVYKERITPDGTQPTYDTWVPLRDRLLQEYPEVVQSSRLNRNEARVVHNNEYFTEGVTYVDASFFDIFSYDVLHGNSERPFTHKHSAVLSVDLARKYFGEENAIGETLELFIPDEDTIMKYEVSAVFDTPPVNISNPIELAIQIESAPSYARFSSQWRSSFLETYVLLDHQDHAPGLTSKFPGLIEDIWGAETRGNTEMKLLALEDYYDTIIGSKSDARTLLWIGIGILLIAAINFINLSTAQASQRTKEIGLRKVLGSFKIQLKVQFITESFVATLVAVIISFALVIVLLPYFNRFFEVSTSLFIFSYLEILGFGLGLSLLLGFINGFYPAVYLSSINVIQSLKKGSALSGSGNFRNVLVIVQFSIALFLITTTILIKNQIEYMTQRNMGFEKEGIMVINALQDDFVDSEEGIIRLNTLKNELRSLPYISNITLSRSIPADWTRSFVFTRPKGWQGDPLRMRYTYMDASFFDVYEIGLEYGSFFLPDKEGDQRNSVILNEAAFKAFNFETADNYVIQLAGRDFNVVGVVKDFNFETLQNEVAPTIMFHRTASHPVHSYISCKMDMTNLPRKIEEIEGLWSKLQSTADFDFSFMEDNVASMYESEERYLRLTSMFSIISILVACLGLYGLTLFIIERRRKEISVRKVLGAETTRILQLIFRDFTRWVAIAFVISVPLVILFILDWLENYHYQDSISWITFGISIAIVLGLVLLTVGYQSLKAATSNPVKYLKDE